jgi:threonine/homoserine/homoserine lactone efflux protein
MLIFMGVSMVLSRGGVIEKLRPPRNDGKSGERTARAASDPFPYHPVIAGVVTTASNPYYFMWWATLGAALTLNALEFGLAVLVVFAVLHWSIDLGWDVFLAYTVHRSRGLWNDRVFIAVFAFCGGVMVLFGIWFGATAVMMLLS